MKLQTATVPLRWRVIIATSITITALFALAGWGLQQYVISEADASVRTELRASIQSYQAVWKGRTQVLAATTALMSGMSDVRAAFMTKDQKTIRDSAQELWSRVSDLPAVFLVLDPEGRLISALGNESSEMSVPPIPLKQAEQRFPKQLAGYVREGKKLFYMVLTPVYVQTSAEPLLLNVLCAGFPIDNRVTHELKQLAPGSEFAFLDKEHVFASTLDRGKSPELLTGRPQPGHRGSFEGYVVSHQTLSDVSGKPVAELRILYSYQSVLRSLRKMKRLLAFAWLLTIAAALLISSYVTRRLLAPVRLLDQAAAAVASGDYRCRVPVQGTDELARLATTFNNMCESIEQAQAELIRQEQIHTIGRLGTSLVHDLRNPLAAIYGGAEMLVDGNLPREHEHRIALNIYRASQRFQELLRDLLNVSRGQKREPERCRLRDIVEAAAESLASCDRGVLIDIDVPETVDVVADCSRAERVFSNLFSNAIDVMPEGGQIAVSMVEDMDGVSVTVHDTGPGLPADIRQKPFRPFVTGKRSGLGLGLTLSRQTMLDLGGDLRVMEAAGGACFCVRFRRPTGKEVEQHEASGALQD